MFADFTVGYVLLNLKILCFLSLNIFKKITKNLTVYFAILQQAASNQYSESKFLFAQERESDQLATLSPGCIKDGDILDNSSWNKKQVRKQLDL